MLTGKIAVVTGAGRGIGRAIALHFAEQGADVVLNYRSSAAAVAQVREEVEALGRRTLLVQADISRFEEAKKLMDETKEAFGRIDILVNNAGVTKDGLLLRMSEEDFEQVIDTNLKGAFFCIRHAARQMMRKKSGRIINISSVVGLMGNAGQCNYAASKAGLLGLTKSAARELSGLGITVNAVAPGFIETDMTDALPKEVREEYRKAIPCGRLGSAEDVAQAVAFLASDGAGYITGQVLSVNGGLYM